MKHVKLLYQNILTYSLALLSLPLTALILVEAAQSGPDKIHKLWAHLQCNLTSLVAYLTILTLFFASYVMSRPRPVFLLDYACHRPRDELKATYTKFMKGSRLCGAFDDSSLDFQRKILERSGLGQETYFPTALHSFPPELSLANSRAEAEEVVFGALDVLFRNTGVNPKEVGVLVVNCSLFDPVHSLSAMVVNRYRMRGSVKSFNLGGMGCSAGVIAVDIARKMLQVHRSTYAVVVSTENITLNWYFGNRKPMLIPNCLFRVEGAAVLLSNRYEDRKRAKYMLVDVVRTHLGSDEGAFRCVYQEEDMEGRIGVSLSKDLMSVAGGALKANITSLGPIVLPVSEQLLFFVNLVAKKLFSKKIKSYIPDFKLAFEHFCIHAGGRAVIDELEKNLQLGSDHVEASRMTLHRLGNTSSSSIWYDLTYIEARGNVRRGHRIWQIAFGSGFKCNSAVWEALCDLKPSKNGPWEDSIDKYPVKIVDN